mmetsp:Transcript_31071/g.43480  ORF Transcript_31071/g.43480 Transcript_31071/m.43480 type:complete len:124 (-) Transcript_31071:68-439(-)
MMCCPFYMDQYEWTKTVCEHLGAGLMVRKASPCEEIRETLRRLLNEPLFSERARRISRVMRAQADAVLEKLGPEMVAPEGSRLGAGASVSAALILSSLAKESPDFVFQAVADTTKSAEADSRQ